MAKKKSSSSPANKTQSTELSQQSIDYLGVSKQPFANEILSQESFFSHQALDKISDNLIHQVQFSELLLLVEGIHGAGKTSFFRQFIQLEIANTKILAIHAEATDTLVQIQQKMSIHLQDLGDANHLDDNLKSLQMFDQTPLAVINDSHVLSDTTLQELLRFQQQLKQEHEVSLKLLLFANTGMSDTLQKISDIHSDQMYTQSLPVYSPKQANAFINHRLRCAGYFGEALLDDAAIAQLFKTCNGSPLDIMIQSVPLIDKAVTKILKPGSGTGKKAFLATLILSALAGAGYAAYIYLNQNTNNATDETLTAKNNTPIKAPTLIAEQTDVIDILENDKIIIDEPAPEENKLSALEPEEKIIEETILEENFPVEKNLEETAHEETLNEDDIDDAEANTNNAVESDSLLAETTTEASTQPPAKLQTSAKNTTLHKIKAPVIETPVIAEPNLNPTLLKLKDMGLRDASWILQQNPQNWTLQLLGAREPETLLKFAKSNQLSSNAAWYKTWLKTKPYYVVVYGSYESRAAARESISNLPPKLRTLKPWVKSMMSAQQAIK